MLTATPFHCQKTVIHKRRRSMFLTNFPHIRARRCPILTKRVGHENLNKNSECDTLGTGIDVINFELHSA